MNFKYLLQLAEKRSIILGSSSPRRYRLLKESGVAFTQVIPHTEETRLENEPPCRYTLRLAEEKALEVAGQAGDDTIVIGADTVVSIGNEILEKPSDKADAHRILSYLSGKQHEVCTALALTAEGRVVASGYEITEVFFNEVTGEQIENYIASGEPMDKAGAYGIQGMGAFLVDRIKGNLDNVIGFPCHLLDRLAGETLNKLQLLG
ncbi:MAG: septum formation protein Maf [candidate division Zixibacteria bacterium]|nr:septum formation protein Maf [candidate division Zixibacteria bacterium]